MLRIDDIIFSLDILEQKFACDLSQCKGSCCRYGDAGAPLTADEAKILDNILPDLKPYLKPEGLKAIEELGTSIIDIDHEPVTPLIDNRECAYSIMENDIYTCSIEKAFMNGKVSFRKPLSCHLFPARAKRFSGFMAVNYSEQPVCAAARRNGKANGIYVYEFLKEPLTRAFGEKVYDELCIAAAQLRRTARKMK